MKFSFGPRIITSFIGMAILTVLIGYFAFVTTRYVQKSSQAIMRENISSLKAAEELELALLNQKGFVSSYFLDGNTIWLKTLEEKKKDFETWFRNAQKVALTIEEEAILDDIFSLYNTYDNQRDRAISLYQTGNINEAKKILLGDMKESLDFLYQKCEDLILVNESLIAKAELSSQKNVFRMTLLIWLTIIITLSLGSFMGFLIAREINEQLVRAAKMASLGQLSANIAHEIRNPLTSIKMRLYTLKQELRDNTEVRDDINVISEDINRMERIVRNFLLFARPAEIRLEKHDINEILGKTINLLMPQIDAHKIEIKKRYNGNAVMAEVDKEQIQQVFLNIILNAIEAMPDGGILEITTSIKKRDKKAGDTLEIEFRDSGKGIDPNLKRRLYEPFFTTKEEGIGLGLFVISQIVQMHKGTINIDSQLKKGTAVTLRLLPLINRI